MQIQSPIPLPLVSNAILSPQLQVREEPPGISPMTVETPLVLLRQRPSDLESRTIPIHLARNNDDRWMVRLQFDRRNAELRVGSKRRRSQAARAWRWRSSLHSESFFPHYPTVCRKPGSRPNPDQFPKVDEPSDDSMICRSGFTPCSDQAFTSTNDL
jgi:hypothetical protein